MTNEVKRFLSEQLNRFFLMKSYSTSLIILLKQLWTKHIQHDQWIQKIPKVDHFYEPVLFFKKQIICDKKRFASKWLLQASE